MPKVVIIPCSGIGKPLGTVGRQAVYRVVEDLRPDTATTTCLALLVAGDEEAVRLVRENPCLALDGCAKECSRKNIELAGGKVSSQLRVLDVYKKHPTLKPQGVLKLDKQGEQLAEVLAEEVARETDKLLEE